MKHLTFIQILHEKLENRGMDASGWEIRSLGAVESTNDKVDQLLDLYDKAIVLAKVQTKGRGRKGNVWYSPDGGIWLSIGFNDQIEVEELSTPVVNSVNNVLRRYVDCEIKPPNDILIDGKKLCGVLVESNIKQKKIEKTIVGIGINVANELPEEVASIATRLNDHTSIDSLYELAADIAVSVISELKISTD